jgi:transcription antitermination factor NusG
MAVACPVTELQWYALKVRARAEHSTSEFLSSRGLEVFCPTYPERKLYSDRVKVSQSALFPGYLFCRLDWSDRLLALSAPNVEYIVGFGSKPAAVPSSEMQAIQAVVMSGAACCPHPFLRVGQKVRLHSGPLANLEGILVSNRGNHRLVISVDLLQRSVAAEVDEALVQVI